MEPARKGREHQFSLVLQHLVQEAAMEPARKGREHGCRPPRQSPSTGRNGARPERAGARGSTSTTTTTTTTGRNGARPERAGARYPLPSSAPGASPPQWSPPGKGGSTESHRSDHCPDGGAAMEPARKGREHEHHPRRVRAAVAWQAAMEPARKGREHVPVPGCTPTTSPSRNGARPERAGALPGVHDRPPEPAAAMEPARKGREHPRG